MGSTVAINKRDIHRLYVTIKRQNHMAKRDLLPTYRDIRHAIRNINSRNTSVLTQVWNHLQRFRVWIARKMYQKLSKPMKRLVKKLVRIEAKVHKTMVCLKPRLQRRYGKLLYPEGLTVKALIEQKQNIFEDLKSDEADNDHVEYIEDCFEDMDRPKFGWKVKITLPDEPCDSSLENPKLNQCTLNLNKNSRSFYSFGNDNAQRRQTGEEFRSGAPPDCRIRFICDENNQGIENPNQAINQNNNNQFSMDGPNLAFTERNTNQVNVSHDWN